MVVQATQRFEDAPVRVIVYGDFLCPDCRFLYQQLKRLEREFDGKLNLAFQFFPLDAQCNHVVDKDSHPGACELSYIAAHDPRKFRQIHDEIFEQFRAARSPQWRQELAKKYGVEDALDDPKTKDLVHRLINTGVEYERTSDRWAHGIRSTPTLIINNRLVIGTFPYPHLRAIFRALVDSAGQVPKSPERKKFMENWVPPS
jgi:protein-disulfide isomerase